VLRLYGEILDRAMVDMPSACAKRDSLALRVHRVERRLAAEPGRCG
jgi:hypothetical protein